MQHDVDLDQLYEFLDCLNYDLELLRSLDSETEQIEATELRGVCVSVGELFGYWTAYDSELARRLQISPKLLNNFIRHFKPISVQEAKVLVSKLISYLKSIEGEIAAQETVEDQHDSTEVVSTAKDQEDEQQATREGVRLAASEWAELPKSDTVKKSIAAISILLDSLVIIANSSNLPEERRALSKIERAELVAILETALLILKAPLVEKGLMSNLMSRLGEVVSKTATKKTEQALGQAADEALEALGAILSKIPWS